MAGMQQLSVFRFSLRICVFAVVVAIGLESVEAQLRLPFRKSESSTVQASAEQEIHLTESAGPWLIMCASFAGEDGAQQAQRVAEELRQQHGLNAYVYRHQFNMDQKYADHGLGWQIDPNAAGDTPGLVPRQMKLASSGSFEEAAVLVGDFADVDDAQAQRTLETIKTIQPRSVQQIPEDALAADSEPTGNRVRAFRDLLSRKADDTESSASSEGLFHQAFLLPNPLIPSEYFSNQGCDEFVQKLNRGIKYSLLKNDARYTVRVATFGADIAIDPNKINQTLDQMKSLKKSGQGMKNSQLANAAKKASVLAAYLRKQGIEAYEFHDRDESIVCVGSFDWLTRSNGGASEVFNPEMAEVIQKFQGTTTSVDHRGNLQAKTYPLPNKLSIAGIACSPSPEPMMVPHARHTSVGSRILDKFR